MSRLGNKIEKLNAIFHQPTRHRWVTVGRLEAADSELYKRTDFGLFAVVMLESDIGTLRRDDVPLHFQPNTIFCLKPGHVVATSLNPDSHPKGWVLAFSPELLTKTGLGRDFYMFHFFDYDVHQSLRLSAADHSLMQRCFGNVDAELRQSQDALTEHLLRLTIGQLLSYCKRLFDRQLAEERDSPASMMLRLDNITTHYLTSGEASRNGQLTVAWCASQFKLSPNYFGDLVKRELHITAQEFVLRKTLDVAKQMLENPNIAISEIATELGFSYPNHFTRLFRSKIGMSPTAYRQAMLN